MTIEKLKGLESLNELAFTEDEKQTMLDIFDKMAQRETKLADCDTNNLEVMVHVMPMINVFREDIIHQEFSRESLLEGAPEHTEDSWQVPRLIK